MDDKKIKDAVRRKYGDLAAGKTPRDCCGEIVDLQAARCGCPAPQTDRATGDLGLGCGLPTEHASLGPGEIVLDLGSGAGVDVFRAALEVGPEGRVIGVDFSPEMIAEAEKNAVEAGHANVEFRRGDIEHLPVESDSVDVVLSNCVINLAPDKAEVFAEIHRVLRPGGRFVVSDVVTRGEMPADLRADLSAWAGCVAGAMDRDEYLALIARAGFDRVRIRDAHEYDYRRSDAWAILSITVEGRKAAS
ncbi:MAG: arsenite methyltransferase [Candidatus Eisenbacteria bacterium]